MRVPSSTRRVRARPSRAALALLVVSPALAAQTTWEVSGAPDSRFGHALALTGDVDGDGLPDVFVGAPGDDTAGNDAGRAFVLRGTDGALLLTLTGEAADDQFGAALAGPGDLDGDGRDDLLVGAYRHDAAGDRAGRAYVFSGLDGHALFVFDGAAPLDEFGVGVTGTGDLDLDGVPDFAVGAHHSSEHGEHSGCVRVFSGATGAQLFLWLGDEPTDDLGHELSAAGDVDADGVPDVVVGMHDNPDPGQVRVFSGATGAILLDYQGSTPGDFLGHAVDGAGDVDGDGFDDVLVGASRDDTVATNAGIVHLLSGATGLVLRSWTGHAASDEFGLSLADAGDFDGDGCADHVIGSPGDDAPGPDAGSARVVSGLDGAEIVTLPGVPQGLRFDAVVDGGRDLDADGRIEIAVGFPYDDVAGPDTGRVRVWSGALPTWSSAGAGLSGALGTPTLRGKGLLAAGTPGRLELRGAAPTALALFLLAVGGVPVPFKGGTLFAAPPILSVLVGTDAQGSLDVPWDAWPAGVPPGTVVVFQYAIADAGALLGVALSDAVAGTTK